MNSRMINSACKRVGTISSRNIASVETSHLTTTWLPVARTVRHESAYARHWQVKRSVQHFSSILNKSLIDLLKSNKLEKFLGNKMTERCWFDNRVFSVFSNYLTWSYHYWRRRQSWKCLCQYVYTMPYKRMLSFLTPYHSKAVKDLMQNGDVCKSNEPIFIPV